MPVQWPTSAAAISNGGFNPIVWSGGKSLWTFCHGPVSMIGAFYMCYRLKRRPTSLRGAMLIAITALGCEMGLSSSATVPKPPSEAANFYA